MDVLQNKFNLKCTIHSRNIIYIWTSSVPTFIEIIKDHVHSSMVKKITPISSKIGNEIKK
jgi:hypothetical protein